MSVKRKYFTNVQNYIQLTKRTTTKCESMVVSEGEESGEEGVQADSKRFCAVGMEESLRNNPLRSLDKEKQTHGKNKSYIY